MKRGGVGNQLLDLTTNWSLFQVLPYSPTHVCFVQLGRPPSRSTSLLHSEYLINIYTRNNNDVDEKESLHHLGIVATAKKWMTTSNSAVLHGRLGEEVKNSTCLGIYDEK